MRSLVVGALFAVLAAARDGPSRVLLRRDPETEWTHTVSESPVNDAVDAITGGSFSLDRPSDVNAATCVTTLLLMALVLTLSWYKLPDGGAWYFGINTRTVKITLLMVTWCLSGTAVMMLVEGYTLSTSVYIMAQIVTTVGYGDFCPSKWYTQIFMSFYVILCILVIAGVISSIADNVLVHFDKTLKQNIVSNPGLSPRDGSGAPSMKLWLDKYQDVLIAATGFWFMVIVGTLYFGGFQGCTCSYGVTQIRGCSMDSQEACRATGGNDLTYMQAWYMSCITLTTVGFGDVTPMSYHGRLFGAFWMLFGVAAMGNFVRAFSEVFMMEKTQERQVDVSQCFNQIDTDGDGYLSRFEFVSFVLLEHGMVTKKMLDAINGQYDNLNVLKNDKVTLEMILHHERQGNKVVITDDTPRAAAGGNSILRHATGAAQRAESSSTYSKNLKP